MGIDDVRVEMSVAMGQVWEPTGIGIEKQGDVKNAKGEQSSGVAVVD